MFYHILYPFSDVVGFLNVFQYITFRAGGAILTAALLGFVLGPKVIAWLKSCQEHGQPIREDGPESHFKKKGTPTMGGALILLSMGISTLLWADLSNAYVWVVLFATLGFGALGAMDDYLKLTRQCTDGLKARYKLFGQLLIGALVTGATMLLFPEKLAGTLSIPVFKDVMLHLGLFFIPWGILVMVGTTNAVNLTDGLDGLAIVPIMLTAACFLLISYFVGNQVFSEYLHLDFVSGVGEVSVLCGALIGAGLGFLWFNAPPAQVFMGDTGSLAVGGMLGSVSLITRHELVLPIVGGLFVLETVSVILQVASFKLTGKRIFLMAPLHHHFEKKGWSETTVVMRFWIISVLFALLGLATLKLR